MVLHRDGDFRNATKANLRVIKRGTSQHRREIPKRGGLSMSQFIGVSQVLRKGEPTGRWIAKIVEDYETTYLGVRGDEEEAALLYDAAAVQIHGREARTNFPQEIGGAEG